MNFYETSHHSDREWECAERIERHFDVRLIQVQTQFVASSPFRVRAMYSSEWRLGNEAPIESYLPRDVAELLNFNTEEDLDSSPDANPNDILYGQETSQVRLSRNALLDGYRTPSEEPSSVRSKGPPFCVLLLWTRLPRGTEYANRTSLTFVW